MNCSYEFCRREDCLKWNCVLVIDDWSACANAQSDRSRLLLILICMKLSLVMLSYVSINLRC